MIKKQDMLKTLESEQSRYTNRLDWLDPLKAFALLAIVFNHMTEALYGANLFDDFSVIKFLGKLGDFGPGVFILTSGFGLAWSESKRKNDSFDFAAFYRRRFFLLWRGCCLLGFFVHADSFYFH